MPRVLCFLAVALSTLTLGLSAEAPPVYGVPLKPDPPLEIDGDLADWGDIPNARHLNQASQVIWGAPAWKGPEDLSGVIRTAWRREALFIAAEVIDDTLQQQQQGPGIWQGDHVECYIDRNFALQEAEAFGDSVTHLALSPGNFKQTGDPLIDTRPEVYIYHPENRPPEGVLIAARQTPGGWTLEAAIPWALLGFDDPQQDTFFRMECALSDTDGEEARQEAMMTTSSAAWGRRRSRLNPAALAGSDGRPAEVIERTGIEETLKIDAGATATLRFPAPAPPAGKEAYLSFQARLHTEKVAGHTPALRLSLNGTPIKGDRLIERPLKARSKGGVLYSMVSNDRFTVYYAPDFLSADHHPTYALLDGVKACSFLLRVTDLLKNEDNQLELSHAAASTVQNPMHLANLALVFRDPPPPPRPKAGPPTGPLPVCRPLATLGMPLDCTEAGPGKLQISTETGRFEVSSRFSSPEPAWVQGSCSAFEHHRQVEEQEGIVLVQETFRNLTDAPLGIMQRHELQAESPFKQCYLAGLQQYGDRAQIATPANPTSYGLTETGGAGLAALSDAFRIHAANYWGDGLLGLADNHLVIPAGAEYCATWAVVPTPTPDYWRFINVLRRQMQVNFTIEGAFAFFRTDPTTEGWSDQEITDFLRFKKVRYCCASITYPRYQGHYTHGTAFQRVSHDNYRQGIERRRRLAPGVQHLIYFHCFLDVTEDGPERFPEARILQPDGEQATYGKPHQRLYCPTQRNAYGKAVAKNVDIILDEIGADGVYWDEHEYSRVAYHYGPPWDGLSGDIDPKSMRVSRLKSSVTLLSEAWRLALAKAIQARGPLIGNGAPLTAAMRTLAFSCFVETGSITNCARAHLYSPIALGDHLTERSEEQAYHVMLGALDYGCVYHWYNDLTVIPTHPHLTRYMYPITPLELHEGYILGKERIITRKSGLFGWGDSSRHEVHAFDDTGREVTGFSAPLIKRDGQSWTELRIAEDWSAAIVRQEAVNE